MYNLYEGDCLEVMQSIKDKSVDLILCDLPYGTTNCKWDHIIPLEPLWKEYNRIIKDHGAIVLSSLPPFTADLIQSNREMFRYEWIWQKTCPVGFLNSHKMPLRAHEVLLVFYKKLPTYNPQMWMSKPYHRKRSGNQRKHTVYSPYKSSETKSNGERFPLDVITFSRDRKTYHPTQKPVKLFEYIIKTYTNPGDLVLDNCAGSGTTGVACSNLSRDCIMIEQDPEYCDLIRERMGKEIKSVTLEQFNRGSS